MADNRTDLFQYLSRREAALHEDLCKWQANFIENPSYALEWSQGTFENAARHKVTKLTLNALSEGHSLEKIINDLKRVVFRDSKSPVRSTSPAHNLIKQELLAAYADMLEIVEPYLGE